MAFQYGGDVTTRLAHQYDETEWLYIHANDNKAK
jgi:hypothetical protein